MDALCITPQVVRSNQQFLAVVHKMCTKDVHNHIGDVPRPGAPPDTESRDWGVPPCPTRGLGVPPGPTRSLEVPPAPIGGLRVPPGPIGGLRVPPGPIGGWVPPGPTRGLGVPPTQTATGSLTVELFPRNRPKWPLSPEYLDSERAG